MLGGLLVTISNTIWTCIWNLRSSHDLFAGAAYTRSAIVIDNTVSNAVSEVKFHLKTQRLSAQCSIAAAGPAGALAGAIVLIVLEYQMRSLLAARTSTIR